MFNKILAVFLAFLSAFLMPIRSIAYSEQKTYISDVAIGSEAGLTAKGYTVIKDNLLGSSDIFVGYKTTHDESLAITDIKAMNMYGGYTQMTYGEVLLQNQEGVADLAERIRTAVNEFRTRYDAGNPYAVLAYDTLNALTYPTDTGKETPLADYMLSGLCTIDDYKKIALMSSNITILYIFNQLSFGVSDNNIAGDSTWVERLVSNGPFDFRDESGELPDEGTINDIYVSNFDTPYMQRAQKLYSSVANFASAYLEAVQNGITLDNAEYSETADEEIGQAFVDGNTVMFDDEAEAVQESYDNDSTSIYAMTLYGFLDKRNDSGEPLYPYGLNSDGTVRSLGQFFIEVGSMTEGEDAYRLLYPLIAVQNNDKTVPLTAGQEVMFNLNGMNAVTFLAFGTEESLAEARSDSEKNVNEMLSINDGKPVSIWYDVNTDIYDEDQQGVYWTSKLAQQAAAGGRYDLLTKKVTQESLTSQQKLRNAFLFTAIGGLGALVVTAAVSMIVFHTISAITAIKGVITAALVMSSCLSTGACIAAIVGTVFIAVAAVAFVAVLVMLIVWLVRRNKKDKEELKLTEIPSVIYDFNTADGGSAVIYYGITDVEKADNEGKNPAYNLNNNMKDTPWVALYYTRDVLMGTPIEVGDSESAVPVKLQWDDMVSPAGYSPVTFFDTIGGANLHEGSSGNKLYAFVMKDAEEYKRTETEGKYIESVALVSYENESAAKSDLISRGYTVIDYNLTSDSKFYSYIGYTTTDNPSDAVTDLRVCYSTGLNPKDGSVKYGDAGYASCGNIGNLLLMFTRYQSAGTPLLASHLVVKGSLGAPQPGYEPVNLFCGGPAFDFNNCDGWTLKTVDDGKEGSSKWNSHAYIYFLPSETYTSGELYLGGLAFFSGNSDAYMADAGWTALTNTNLANGLSEDGITYNLAEKVQDGNTVLAFTTTYNPYRAIYDIRYFEAEASANTLRYNLTLLSGAVACDVFQQGGGSVGNNRMVRISHAYRSPNHYEGGAYFEPSEYFETTCYRYYLDSESECTVFDINGKEETACNLCCAGLYVTGRYSVNNKFVSPIAISEISISSNPIYNVKLKTPVRSATNYYSKAGANLAYNDKYRSGDFYLYINRADPYAVKPTYIATVNVSYYEGNDLADNKNMTPYDTAVESLLGYGAGELYTVNLTGDGSWKDRIKDYTHEYEILSHDDFAPTYYQHLNYISHDTKYSVALIWVTYTDSSSMGISDLEIYETDVKDFKGIVTDSNLSETQACGMGFRLHGEGSYYYLRAVRNNGHQITDLIIDKDIMTRNYWTTISTEGTVSSYEEYYIKTKHYQNAKLKYYISGIYSATGSTESEAQKTLLSQGCRYCCPYNLSPDDNHPVYIGYTLATSYKKAYSGILLYDAGQNKTVTSVTVGRNVYTRVTDSLNGGMYDSIISMYVTNSVAKACENGAKTAKDGHYIMDIMFFSKNNLNDYAPGTILYDYLDENTKQYVRDYLLDTNGDILKWDIVTNNVNEIVNCNIGSNEPVYMYIRYSDNATPNYNKINGSVFADNPSTTVIITVVSVLVVFGFVYYVIRKYKHNNNEQAAVKQSEEDTNI